MRAGEPSSTTVYGLRIAGAVTAACVPTLTRVNGVSQWADFDAELSPQMMIRRLRATAATAEVRLCPVSTVDAVAVVVGARLWCAVFSHRLVDPSGLGDDAMGWAAALTERAAGQRCGWDDAGDCGPVLLSASAHGVGDRISAEAAAIVRWLEQCTDISSDAVWLRVTADVVAGQDAVAGDTVSVLPEVAGWCVSQVSGLQQPW